MKINFRLWRVLLRGVAVDFALRQRLMNGIICIRLVGRYPTIGLTSHLTESGRMGSGMCKHAFGGPPSSLDLPNRSGVSVGVQRCAWCYLFPAAVSVTKSLKMKLPLSDRIPTGPLMSEMCLASILPDQTLRPSMVTAQVYRPSVSVTDAPKRCAFWVAAVMPRGFKGTRPSCR